MGVFPLAAAVVATVFCAALVRQNMVRHRPYQLLWAAAMGMYALASLALFIGVTFGWSSWWYRVYWLFGAVLNVPFLAGGEAELLARRAWVNRLVPALLAALTAVAIALVWTAPIAPSSLRDAFPLGAEVFADAPAALIVARAYSYTAYAFLLGGALWSAWKMRATHGLRDRFWGTLLIALGATIVAAGSAFAATGILIGFSATLAAGITVMFLGFVRASVTSVPDVIASD